MLRVSTKERSLIGQKFLFLQRLCRNWAHRRYQKCEIWQRSWLWEHYSVTSGTDWLIAFMIKPGVTFRGKLVQHRPRPIVHLRGQPTSLGHREEGFQLSGPTSPNNL